MAERRIDETTLFEWLGGFGISAFIAGFRGMGLIVALVACVPLALFADYFISPYLALVRDGWTTLEQRRRRDVGTILLPATLVVVFAIGFVIGPDE